jgi:molybdate transport repressor ModE-like protein
VKRVVLIHYIRYAYVSIEIVTPEIMSVRGLVYALRDPVRALRDQEDKMELQQLRGLCEVAREGSFTRAARHLFVTQSAVSQQIRALEEEVGQRLVERTRGGARLTAAGQILCRRARVVFEELRLARDEIDGQVGAISGRVVLATSDTNCTYVLPPVLRVFREQFPEVEVDIRNKMSSEIAPLVLEDEIDFGLATLPLQHPRLVCESLFERRDVWICAADHVLAHRRRVAATTVAEGPLLALERGSQSRVLFDEFFERARVAPRIAMELGSIEVLKRFAEIGFGMAMVPAVAVEDEVAAGRLVSITPTGAPKRWVGLVQHQSRVPSTATAALIERMRSHVWQVPSR